MHAIYSCMLFIICAYEFISTYSLLIEMKSLIFAALVMALFLQMAWGTRPAQDKRSLNVRQLPNFVPET